MKNPFSPANQGEMNLKRNAYDHSRTSLFSTEFGRLDPAFIQEVIPGDSFEIDGSLAIQGMPTVFPLQTRVRASVEFYYSRNRTVFDGFEDFIFRTKDIEQPWLRMSVERAKEMISVGSLGDFFGIPTTMVPDSRTYNPIHFNYPSVYLCDTSVPIAVEKSRSFAMSFIESLRSNNSPLSNNPLDTSNIWRIGYALASFSNVMNMPLNNGDGVAKSFLVSESIRTAYSGDIPSSDISNFFIVFTDENNVPITQSFPVVLQYNSQNSTLILDVYDSDDWENEVNLNLLTSSLLQRYSSYKIAFCFAEPTSGNTSYLNRYNIFLARDVNEVDGYWVSTFDVSQLVFPSLFVNYIVIADTIVDSTDDSVVSLNPFVGSSPVLKVNALPFRHYEQITNYYYRNDKNNPYVLDGEPQYNEFIPSHAAGADDNVYKFHYRNWELDRYTSAVQSPQFGEAPLVGLTFSGSDTAVLSFQDANDPNKTYTATVGVDDTDHVVTIEDFSSDIPSANLKKLQSQMQSRYGLSINDLRVTNSFQRFLENVLRRGLRYRNQLKSHFGVGVDYPDIDVPQYIGGYSGELQVGKVTNMAETSEAPLGDFGGSLSGVIQSKHPIRCYCPEHGYIIGIVSITPIPVYTQTCNKVMIKRDPFDYYLPEFGKIGFVPMHYSEVMPLQTPQDGSVNDVFGYQKAWYDYMQSYDEAHGYFRTSLKDFVLQRVFKDRPELVEDFTVVDPDQLSDVFVTTKIEDKYGVKDRFMCNFYNHVIVKRVIPRVGTPSLE